MTKEELITTYNTLQWLKDLTQKGDRYGWGYSEESVNIVLAHIDNEIRIKEKE